MDFELVIKVIVLAVAAVGIPIGAYAAIVATRAIWVKGEPGKLGAEDLRTLHDRLAELEERVGHIAELEERLDFAERMLAQRPEPHELGPGRSA